MLHDLMNEALLQKLVDRKKIAAEARLLVLQERLGKQKSISEILVERKLMSEQDLFSFLCEEFGFAPIALESFELEEREVLRLIPAAFAAKHKVLPISKHENVLTVAMLNPLDLTLIDDMQAITGLRVKPLAAMSSELMSAITRMYPREVGLEVAKADAMPQHEETFEELIKIVQDARSGEGSVELTDLMRQAQETPVVKVANVLLIEGIKRRASDVFVEPWENTIRVRYRVDGLLEEGKQPPKTMGSALVSRFKVMSQLNIAERRVPQDGRFRIKVQDREVDIRVSIIPSSYGEKVCLRILDKKTQAQSLERLGFSDRELESLKAVSGRPHGMILVTGPTGSGKTTTLYSILKYLDSPEKNITTVEDPVEYQVEGINQVNIRDKIGLTFPAALRSILRQDPNIILIGEIRDAETMDIAIKAALTGHLVLSSLHTNDTCGSVVRMINMGVEPYLIASSVLMITAQRLLRRFCASCKASYAPEASLLQKLRVEPVKGQVLYRPAGCPRCRHTGYAGRTVITEILTLSPELKAMIVKRVTGDEFKQQARRSGMSTLRESAVRKVVAGETSADEMFRVTTGDQELENDLVQP